MYCYVHDVNETEGIILMAQLNLGTQIIDEANLAEMVSKLRKVMDLRDLQNTLPIKKELVEHYIELFNFIFKEYIQTKEENEGQHSMFK